MPASSQGLPTSGMRETFSPHFEQLILTASIQGLCGEWPANSSQPSTARCFQLLLAADDFDVAAFWHS